MNENGQKIIKSIMEIENIVLVSWLKVAQTGGLYLYYTPTTTTVAYAIARAAYPSHGIIVLCFVRILQPLLVHSSSNRWCLGL